MNVGIVRYMTVYGDCLTQYKKRDVITRQMILDIIGPTEDNIQITCASTADILPSYVKYRLQLRDLIRLKILFTNMGDQT